MLLFLNDLIRKVFDEVSEHNISNSAAHLQCWKCIKHLQIRYNLFHR